MKASLKLIGGKKLLSPNNGLITRPTSARTREAVINILRSRFDRCHWLDLFSGSGIMGCEALQQGARRVLSIELNKKAYKVCKKNLINTASEANHPNHLEIVCDEVVRVLKKGAQSQSKKFKKKFPNLDHRFDFVYLDPPYDSDIYFSVLESLLTGDWLKEDALVICEYSKNSMPNISSKWLHQDQKVYGKTGLLLITPIQA